MENDALFGWKLIRRLNGKTVLICFDAAHRHMIGDIATHLDEAGNTVIMLPTDGAEIPFRMRRYRSLTGPEDLSAETKIHALIALTRSRRALTAALRAANPELFCGDVRDFV